MDPVAAYIMSFIGADDAHLSRIAGQEVKGHNVQPSIGEEAGRLLALLVKAVRAESVLEIGTSLGYATVWLGQALRSTGGSIISIEHEKALFLEAQRNISGAGLADIVKLVHGDANAVLEKLQGPFDIILQDSDKALYPKMLDRCVRLARNGGLIVADDALFKPRGIDSKFSDPIDEYNRLVFDDSRLYSTILPIGDGITLSVKVRDE